MNPQLTPCSCLRYTEEIISRWNLCNVLADATREHDVWGKMHGIRSSSLPHAATFLPWWWWWHIISHIGLVLVYGCPSVTCPWEERSEPDVQDKRPFGSLMDFPQGCMAARGFPHLPVANGKNCPQHECSDPLNPIVGGWKTTTELGWSNLSVPMELK